MSMKGRSWHSEKYRYGFNGQEKDTDINEEGNHTTAEFWEYSSVIGRRWNIDPVIKEHESPYATFANNPINFIDINGADTLNSQGSTIKGKNRLNWNISGSKNLYIALEDTDLTYDYAKIQESAKGWDYIMGTDINEIRLKLYEIYGDNVGNIENMIFRSHGASNVSNGSVGPILNKYGVLKGFQNKGSIPVKSFIYFEKLLASNANILLTACSICQPNHSLMSAFGSFFLKDNPDRTLYINRTKTLSTGYNFITDNGKAEHPSEKKGHWLQFNQSLVASHEKYGYWAGFIKLRWDAKLKKATFEDAYFNVKIMTSGWFNSAEIRSEYIKDKNGENRKTDLKQ